MKTPGAFEEWWAVLHQQHYGAEYRIVANQAYDAGRASRDEEVRQLREVLKHGRDEVANPDFDSQGRQLPVDVERLAVIDAALAATQEKSS